MSGINFLQPPVDLSSNPHAQLITGNVELSTLHEDKIAKKATSI